MLKKSIAALLACAACSVSVLAAQAVPPTIFYDTVSLNTTAAVQDGTVYLPLRVTAEAMGYTVTWAKTNAGSVATFEKDGKGFTLNQTTDEVTTTDGHTYYPDEGSVLISDSMYLSAGDFSELFPVSVLSKDSTVSISDITQNDLTITTKHETSNENGLTVDLQYPQISGLSSAYAQNEINAAFASAAANARKEGQANAAELAADSIPRVCSSYLNYRIAYNQNGLLSTVLDDYQYAGGAHGSTVQTGLTYDLATGKTISLDDLMSDAAGARKVINLAVRTQIETRDLPELATFTELGENPDYYLSNNGLVIFFQQYEYFPYAAGIQSYTIPYADLKAYLKSDYSFLAQTPAVLSTDSVNTLSVGQDAYLILNANATTGYEWKAETDNDAAAAVVGSVYLPDAHDAGMVGYGGKTVFHIKARSKGSTTLTLHYVRSWESGDVQTLTCQISVA